MLPLFLRNYILFFSLLSYLMRSFFVTGLVNNQPNMKLWFLHTLTIKDGESEHSNFKPREENLQRK